MTYVSFRGRTHRFDPTIKNVKFFSQTHHFGFFAYDVSNFLFKKQL